MKKNLIAAVTAFTLMSCLSGCGKKNAPAPTPAAAAAQSAEEAPPTLPSIASRLSSYQPVDYGESVDLKGFMAYRALFMRMAAADKAFDGKKFAEMALLEIGAETDAFKREDLVQKHAGAISEVRKQAIDKVFIYDSSARPFPMTGSVSAYDMDNESYTITFSLDGFNIGYGWQDKSRQYKYSLQMSTPSIAKGRSCFECSKDFDVAVKVPKAQAREIEGKLSALRGAGNGSAQIPAGFFVSVVKVDDSANWERAAVQTRLDAIALRMPGTPIGSPLIFIDGPALKRK